VLAALILWWADSGAMSEDPPSTEEIVGTWECYYVSAGFLHRAGLDRNDFTSKLIFTDASRVTVEGMPDEEDTVSFSRSWELRRPGSTPAGAWTIEIDSGPRLGPYRLVCRKKLGRMTLQKNVDVIYGYEVLYRRVSDEPEDESHSNHEARTSRG